MPRKFSHFTEVTSFSQLQYKTKNQEELRSSVKQRITRNRSSFSSQRWSSSISCCCRINLSSMRCVGRTWLIPRMSKVPESWNPQQVYSVSQFKICMNRSRNSEITKGKLFRSQFSAAVKQSLFSSSRTEAEQRKELFPTLKFLSALCT